MSRYSFLQNKGKYFKKTFVTVVIIAVVLFIATSVFSIVGNSNDRERRIMLLETAELNKTIANFKTHLEDVSTICGFLSTADFDKKLTGIPSDNYNAYLDISEQVNSYLSIFSQIAEISIRTAGNNFYSSDYNVKTFTERLEQAQTVANIENVNIYVIACEDAYNIIFFEYLKKNGSGHSLNDVRISGNSIALGKEILAHDDLRKEYIVTCDGMIVSSFDLNCIGQGVDTVIGTQFNVAELQEYIKTKDNSLLTVKKIDGMELYAVSVTEREYYSNYFEFSYVKTVLICLVCAVIAFGVCMVALQFSYRPILKILKQMSYYQDVELGNNVNEIEYINSKFKQLYENNERLNETTAKIYKELKTWNMAALQAQICPHFLYNTLDAINWLAYDRFNKDNEISKIAKKTAIIMRSSLDITRMFSDIGEEVEITRQYVDIIDIRNEGQIKFFWDIDDSILEYIIPRLTIQAMLENAVTHAFGNNLADNRVFVSIKEHGDDIYIEVEDNGDGISPERLEEIRKNIEQEGASGSKNIGLRNINQRCKIVFGENYGLTIISKLGLGSKFILKIHKETME